MDSFGFSDDLRQKIYSSQSELPSTEFVVMEENAQALDVFLYCQSQWRYSTNGITGLDYTAVLAVIAVRIKKKNQSRVMDEVRLIESGALKAISKKRDS